MKNIRVTVKRLGFAKEEYGQLVTDTNVKEHFAHLKATGVTQWCSGDTIKEHATLHDLVCYLAYISTETNEKELITTLKENMEYDNDDTFYLALLDVLDQKKIYICVDNKNHVYFVGPNDERIIKVEEI